MPTPTAAARQVSPTSGGAKENKACTASRTASMNQLTISIFASKNRLPDHPVRLGHAELTENGGGDIPQLRRGHADGTIAEEHAGNLVRRHAVVADPGLGIVFQHIPGNGAERSLPGGAVAAVEADEEVRRVFQIPAAERLFGEVHPPDDLLAGEGILELRQAPGQALQHLPLIGFRHDAARFPSFEVDVDGIQTDRKSTRLN